MANIFGGVEPPSWLQRIAQPIDARAAGEEIGFGLSAAILSLQQDPDKPNPDGTFGLKGLQKGIAEARENEADPMWRLKEKQLEGNVVNTWANAATQWQGIDARNRDLANWTKEDLPALTKYQDALKTDPAAIPPVMKSQQGFQALGQIERNRIAMEQAKIRMDNSKLAVDNEKRAAEFNNALGAAPQSVQSAIDELPNQGWNVDRLGRRTSPSTAALKLYNDWATANGQSPEKSFGYRANQMEIQKAKDEAAKARLEQTQTGKEKIEGMKESAAKSLETQKAANKLTFEKERQKDRETLADINQKYKVDIEKMKLDAKTDQGKVVSEDEFVNRHLNTVFNAMYKQSQNPKQALADAEKALRSRYHVAHQPSAAPPPVSQPPPTPVPPPAKTTGTNTDSDPLGLFK